MLLVGIDVASKKHDIVIMNNEGSIYKKAFVIKNSMEEYKKLLSTIQAAKITL